MLELGGEPKRLVSTFLAYRNDIDIYTEDELKDKEFYKVLFSRLVNEDLKINDITPLGSKEDVLKRCQNEPDNGRKKIFIIDGDVKIINGSGLPTIKNLFILDAYCIENIIFDENSVLNFVYLNCGTKSKEQIKDELKFQQWLEGYTASLVELFLHFAVLDFFGGKFELFNSNKYHVQSVFKADLVTADITKLKDEILGITTTENYNKKLEELRAAWPITSKSLLTIVSGKDYLIPILLFKVQEFRKSKATPSKEEAKLVLAHHCDLDKLSKLKTAMIRA
jgi:hypothetical protein